MMNTDNNYQDVFNDISNKKCSIKAYVHLSYGTNPDTWLQRYNDGKEFEPSPYGFHNAEKFGFDVTYSSDNLSWLMWRISQICRRLTKLDPPHAFINRHRMAKADVIWTMSEWEAIMVQLMMVLRIIPHRPVIGTAIWIIHQWKGFNFFFKNFYRFFLKRLHLLVVHTKPCLIECNQQLPEVNVKLMNFGISSSTFAKNGTANNVIPIRIVAAGNDATRDWDILLDAFGNNPLIDLVIINQKLDENLLLKYSNLTIPRSPTVDKFLELYSQATYIAIPLKENIYSGITVALEAMALGVPVIATRTGGITTYMEEDEAILVPPNDVEAWRSAIYSQTAEERIAMVERAYHRFKDQDYSTIGLMKQFAFFSKEAIC